MKIQNVTGPFQAAETYNAAADHYDDEALGFWRRHGRKIVDLSALVRGALVLDVGCGTGASALPAALAVGREGRVIGVDIAENMLDRARAKAASLGIGNAVFEQKDMMRSDFPDAHFDSVLSVFSIFFVDDMERLIAELWRMVRPGGKLAVTSWGRDAFQPCAALFYEEIRAVKPNTPHGEPPWERLAEERALRQVFLDGGATAPEVWSVSDRQPLSDPADWWTIALGSGFRSEIERLAPKDRERVRKNMQLRLSAMSIDAIETNALHAVAQKPR